MRRFPGPLKQAGSFEAGSFAAGSLRRKGSDICRPAPLSLLFVTSFLELNIELGLTNGLRFY